MKFWLVLALCGLGGAFLAVAAAVAAVAAHKQRRCTASVWARVTELRAKDYGEERRTLYHPLYVYEVDGVKYTGLGASLSGRVPQVGDRVPVLYDPEQPGRSYIRGYDDTVYRILGIVFGLVGCVMLAAGIGVAVFV